MKLRAAAVLVAALLSAGPAWADDDFLDHYKAGLAAVTRKDWTTAADRMRQAISGKGDEDARLARRLYLKRYLPHYQLGRALFEQGDCAGALAAWKESERQGVVQQFEEHRLLSRDRATCQESEALASEVAVALGVARARLAAADEAARRVSEARSGQSVAEIWTQGEPSLESRERAALELLASARLKLPAEPTPADLPRLREASDLAAQAQTRFEEIESTSQDQQAQVSSEETELRSGLEDQLKAAATLLASHRFLEPYPPEMARRRAELAAAVAAAEALPRNADRAAVDASAEALLAAQNRLKRAVAPPPEALNRGAEAFFRGDYQEALRQLEGAQLNEPRAAALAALFRAAAHFGVWASGGEKDTSQLEAARREIRACRAADPERRPTTLAFSPRFVELFTRETSPSPP